ncbi:aldehyde dehydrogenase [bacterium (Candidatus Blackallbacteria) CG17_big_fil_post_rev_8_21_14_2_50_48_46]|uniref:Aldehyde dehydrogenase n=1 Tax=bacterium (Candidatus Blackallbacteria) CG17_big_fil_post_rev_8_21_14_2_50_48_46 TaxID=2014261 RepID=A0A2M7G5H8_9BACT|nr:MAG: aldehyde dehydrogenase [bacterium (Candidatus Blackallbacteria) CG18_big_fil_WC_8_21_14_2_50_49_26]PIW17209.1 MAG: aldehyde dehydrogenase [bacterium (Candidatus Blackallbacteria) CG17_big_fil_post_rev_8_21_14_2_50_48_46]PIW51000.1 MAG: aldehyde dehydrogenase [bacterium (Candidatus Blackallbacteria) CG13_big_fil_rev_8_21_14_2_50_49_14]
MKPIFINGRAQTAHSELALKILNPATLESLGQVANCREADVNAAVSAARAAQHAWWKMPESEKSHYLHRVAERIAERAAEMAELLACETGKPLIEAKDCLEWVSACFRYYGEVIRVSKGVVFPPVAPHQINFTVREPFGVVACIAPFNFPLLLSAWKVAPALACGNTVVVKPPHQNPLSSLLFAECFSDLPAGVFNLVTGDGETGNLLVRHPQVDMIAFTGSTAVGRKIAAAAGEQLKKVNLELGGIDPFIVFADADLSIAAKGAVWARLLNAGQVCTSSKRIIVEASVAEEFTRLLLEEVANVQVGDPLLPATDMGPVISEEALEKLETQIERLKAEGAELLVGGCRFQPQGLPGYFLQPTVFSQVKHGGMATTEEFFGPVINLFTAQNADHAIEMANDSEYGLGATIYTNNLQIAMKAMENIKAGSFWINDPLTDNEAAPFGGMRASGIGRELGAEGLECFREPKHVHLDYVIEKKDYWFPYAQR